MTVPSLTLTEDELRAVEKKWSDERGRRLAQVQQKIRGIERTLRSRKEHLVFRQLQLEDPSRFLCWDDTLDGKFQFTVGGRGGSNGEFLTSYKDPEPLHCLTGDLQDLVHLIVHGGRPNVLLAKSLTDLTYVELSLEGMGEEESDATVS